MDGYMKCVQDPERETHRANINTFLTLSTMAALLNNPYAMRRAVNVPLTQDDRRERNKRLRKKAKAKRKGRR